MDESYISSAAWIVAFILIDALISLAYAAVTNSDDDGMRDDHDSELLKKRLAMAGQMSMVLLRFTAAVILVDGISGPLAEQFTMVPTPVVHALLLIPLGVLTVIFGDLLPTTIGTAYANGLAPTLRPLMIGLALILRPLLALTHLINMLMLRMFGVTGTVVSASEEQILAIVDADETFEDDERKMIQSVLQLDDLTVTEMMIPRIDIVAVEKDTSIADARRVFLESGHSRLPVFEDNIDHIVGLVYVKDLLEVWHNGHTTVGSVAEIMRPVQFVPETMTADNLLHLFQREKVHLAIVLEEYGGTGGLVTLENLIEEIVGDIQDEYDEDEPQYVVKLNDNEYCFDAGVMLYEVNEELETELDDDDVDTLGGYIFMMLERVPEVGEVLLDNNLEITVKKVEGRRIREVHVRKLDITEVEKADDIQPEPLPTPPENSTKTA